MANEDTYEKLSPQQRENAVRKEMLPFAIYAAIPIIITLIIAFVFGPPL